MKIALIFLELEDCVYLRYKKQMRVPLGLLYLKASLQDKGHSVDILDQRVSFFSEQSLIRKINKNQYDVIGFHVNSININNTLKYIHDVHRSLKDKIIIAGGPGACQYDELLSQGCTAVIHEEGEERFPEFLACINKNESFDRIDGISYISNSGELVHRNPVKLVDIDKLGMPYWDKYLISLYEDSYIPTLKKPSATMLASRGCINKCAFCTTPGKFKEKRYRAREPENVIAEMKKLKLLYDIKYITFKDDLFGIKPGWIYEFCEKLIREKLNINWFCALHPMSFRTEKERVYSLMKKAGCDCIAYGAQSSSKTILKNINRNTSEPEELAKNLAICRKLDIRTNTTYILGLPGETRETIKCSIDFCLKYRPDLVDYHELVILPDSALAGKNINELTSLSKKEILAYCNKAMFQFYLNPKIILNFILRIICRNKNITKNICILLMTYFVSPFSKLASLSKE